MYYFAEAFDLFEWDTWGSAAEPACDIECYGWHTLGYINGHEGFNKLRYATESSLETPPCATSSFSDFFDLDFCRAFPERCE